MKIYLVDLRNDLVGHYHIMRFLARINNAEEIDTCEKKYKFRSHPLLFFRERKRIVKDTMREILNKQDQNKDTIIIHYLTIDKLYFLFWLFPGLLKGEKIIATIHRVPHNYILKKVLVYFSTRIDAIIVLSGYIENEMKRIGVRNVYSVEHPSFYDYDKVPSKRTLRQRDKIDDNVVVFSFLGGTRYEKGLDILLDSFKYIGDDYKKRILLNVAGEEKDISLDFIKKKAEEYHINYRCNLRRLTDAEFMENIILSDYVVTPYRNSFNGMSGLLAEALSQRKGCILPNYGILGFYGKMLDYNMCFESENSASLANSISYCLTHLPRVSEECASKFQKSTFLNGILYTYNKIANNETAF